MCSELCSIAVGTEGSFLSTSSLYHWWGSWNASSEGGFLCCVCSPDFHKRNGFIMILLLLLDLRRFGQCYMEAAEVPPAVWFVWHQCGTATVSSSSLHSPGTLSIPLLYLTSRQTKACLEPPLREVLSFILLKHVTSSVFLERTQLLSDPLICCSLNPNVGWSLSTFNWMVSSLKFHPLLHPMSRCSGVAPGQALFPCLVAWNSHGHGNAGCPSWVHLPLAIP